jgi:hypothetical protein
MGERCDLCSLFQFSERNLQLRAAGKDNAAFDEVFELAQLKRSLGLRSKTCLNTETIVYDHASKDSRVTKLASVRRRSSSRAACHFEGEKISPNTLRITPVNSIKTRRVDCDGFLPIQICGVTTTRGSQGHCPRIAVLLSHYHNDPDSPNKCRMKLISALVLLSEGALFINRAVARRK